MKKPIQELTLLPEEIIEIKFPSMPDMYIAAGFFKPNGYDGYWKIFPKEFETKNDAEKFCKSKIRNGWLCFKIFNLHGT